MEFASNLWNNWNDRVDCDVGKGIGKPAHAKKRASLGLRNRPLIERVRLFRDHGFCLSFRDLATKDEQQEDLQRVNASRQIEKAFFAESFENRAAPKIGEGTCGRPDHIINANHPREGATRPVLADLRFKRGPRETHSDRPADHHRYLSRNSLPLTGYDQTCNSEAQTEKHRLKVAFALGELASVPGGEDVNGAIDRGKGQVAGIPETEMSLQEKENVIIEIDRAQRVECFDEEETGVNAETGALRHRVIYQGGGPAFHD